MKVEIFSDIACPWCYIAKHRFESALQEFAHRGSVQVEWKSFELDPTRPAKSNISHAEYLTKVRGFGQAQARGMENDCARLGAAEGLELNFDLLKLFNTRDAHKILHFAKTKGLQTALKERLFKAAFTDGEEIGDRDVLIRLGAEVGLSKAGLARALDSDEYLKAVLDDEEEARASSVTGVPYFVLDGKFAVSGAREKAVFSQALAAVWDIGHPSIASEGQASGICGSDGCAI